MSPTEGSIEHAVIVETEVHFSLHELSRACGADITLIQTLVHEGVLTPQGDDPAQWRFEGTTLLRARTAVRIMRDLELSPAGAALVLDLFGEIRELRMELKRMRG